jgi:hypothetical protein
MSAEPVQDYTRTPEFGLAWEAWLASDDSLSYRQGFNRAENRVKGVAWAMSAMLAKRDQEIEELSGRLQEIANRY